jgi:glyoxylase-like metal-dependent hydrolase (beta-lactamase superfamily II)
MIGSSFHVSGLVVARGKNLTATYATHGHGDHFFGTSTAASTTCLHVP